MESGSGEAYVWRPARMPDRGEELGVFSDWLSCQDIHGPVAIEAPVVAGARNLRTAIDMSLTSGAVAAGIYRLGLRVLFVPVASWKKVVVGKGNATKEEVAAHVRKADRRFHAAASGDQDLFDAWCISDWCRRTTAEVDG